MTEILRHDLAWAFKVWSNDPFDLGWGWTSTADLTNTKEIHCICMCVCQHADSHCNTHLETTCVNDKKCDGLKCVTCPRSSSLAPCPSVLDPDTDPPPALLNCHSTCQRRSEMWISASCVHNHASNGEPRITRNKSRGKSRVMLTRWHLLSRILNMPLHSDCMNLDMRGTIWHHTGTNSAEKGSCYYWSLAQLPWA